MEGLDDARTLVERARTVSVLTGAGISTASGIPDFRGPEGVWTKDPAAELLSTYEVWVADQEVRRAAWRRRVDDPRPAAACRTTGTVPSSTLERTGRLDTLVTQNIDGLHADAGSDPTRIVEIHGSSRDAVCLRCGRPRPDRGGARPRGVRRRGAGLPGRAAATSVCGGILKSAVISFGQSLVAADLARAEAAAARCDVLLAVGSTLSVWPIAGMVPIAHVERCGRRRRERWPDGDGRARDRPGRRADRGVLPRLLVGLTVS